MIAQLEFKFDKEVEQPVTQQSPTLSYMKKLSEALEAQKQNICNALEYADGTHTFDDVVSMVFSGKVVFWPYKDSFLITEVLEYPQKRVLHVFLAGGVLEDLCDVQDKLKELARKSNCTALSLCGRRGWLKPLAVYGWKPGGSTLVCEVH